MYLIATFGFFMLILSTIMVVKPESFANGIISFSEKTYFHLFEIISRIIAGIIFITYSSGTVFPLVFDIGGFVLILVGFGLALTPPRFHKKYAVWSANNFRNKFRLIGVFSIPLSLFIVYAAIGKQLNW